MHFSPIFSLFGAISPHILIGRCEKVSCAVPLLFYGESQSIKYIPRYAYSDITTLLPPSRLCSVPGSK